MLIAASYGLESISPIRIGIIDDHQVMIRGVEDFLVMNYLNGHPLELVGQANTLKEGLKMLKDTQPDIVLLDIWLCHGSMIENSLDLLAQLKREKLQIPVIIYTGEILNKDLLKKFYQTGIQGMLFKHDAPDILLEAIYSVYTGSNYFSKQIKLSLKLEETKLSKYHLELRLPLLSSQERRYLWLTLNHITRKEIALKMMVAVTTVSEYRKRAFEKLKIIHIQELEEMTTLQILKQLDPSLEWPLPLSPSLSLS